MGNDCTHNCSDNELNELFDLVTGIWGLMSQFMTKVCEEKHTQLKVCFGARSSELHFIRSVLSMCLLYDAFCVPFSESTVQPIQPCDSTTLARAHFFQYELCAPAKNRSANAKA